jgi:hypothetical protein
MSRIIYSRAVKTGVGLRGRCESWSPPRSLLAALVACSAILVPTACGGSSVTADQQDQQMVRRDATGLTVPNQIACTGPQCRVATSYAFHSLTEASLVAVPIVFMINTDDRIPLVKALRLKITNWATGDTAEFDCHLTRPVRSGSFDVTSLHKICSANLAPAA